jgi:hypothetical protein
MKEATLLFELALWKSLLDQALGNITNPNEYQIEVHGHGRVKKTIL